MIYKWVAVAKGVTALNKAIESQFRKPFDSWCKVDEKTKKYWFSVFKVNEQLIVYYYQVI